MLIRVSKGEELKAAGIPFTSKSLYYFHTSGKYSIMFRKIGKSLFVDTIEWRKILLDSEDKAKKRVYEIHNELVSGKINGIFNE